MTQIAAETRAAARRLPLHQRIVWARNQKNISQERFAEQIGTSRRHMIRIEKGQHKPGPILRSRIADATEQPLEFFLDEDDEESDPAMRDAFALFVDLMDRLQAHRQLPVAPPVAEEPA